ncbi:hypothertical protein [Thermus thermophilus HB8]|uniref:Hypothertical protein n=1 Tax=Thermus thermophilus (strain ATCC 27634 / DSM 579 / HB8) TaxID=300852 RepID=Q5SJU3_THET8|nr:hypothertical protein [Thermus thermophilus HB8]
MQPREDVPGLGREGRGRNPLTGLNPLQRTSSGPPRG